MPAVRDHARGADDLGVADLPIVPDRGCAVVVAPEDVALAVAVEVALAGDVPSGGDEARIGYPVRAGDLPIVPDRIGAVVIVPENVAMEVRVGVVGGFEADETFGVQTGLVNIQQRQRIAAAEVKNDIASGLRG